MEIFFPPVSYVEKDGFFPSALLLKLISYKYKKRQQIENCAIADINGPTQFFILF